MVAIATPLRAGFWIRVVALLIDSAIVSAFLVGVALVLRLDAMAVVTGLDPVGFVINTASYLAYFTYFWSSYGSGQTPGMRLLRLKVVRTDGTSLTPVQALVRNVGLIVASIPFGLGLLWVAFDPEKQGWHDKIASTYVVRA